ncbi:MAG: inorganic phosphate transporter [Desulfomonilaceae bacterium]|jgi:PiT family inorganic phosphate transporter
MSDYYLLGLSIFAGAYMAWNIGANDVANSMASSVGARAITLRQALVLATVLTFLGSSLVGSHVAQTIRKGIVHSQVIGDPQIILLGLLSALLSASLWVCLATYQNLPVSTTHSIVGAMIGFGIVAGGLSAVNWKQVIYIVTSWILSPLLTAAGAFVMFRFIDKAVLARMDTTGGVARTTPILIAATLSIMTLSLLLDTPLGSKIGLSVTGAFIASLGVGIASYMVFKIGLGILLRRGNSSLGEGDKIFRYLQVMTACYVAFGNGANDVANAMGPLAGVYFIYSTGTTAESSPIPVWMLAFGGSMICVGICTWGYRVIETVGSKITELNNIRGFTVEFSAATFILIASMLGLPVSTTHAAVGAYIGVGLARGLAALDLGVLWKIMLYWIITVPVAAVTCAVIYFILSTIFIGR